MQAILEFALDHIYLVIVVIGLIYSMFFRKSPLERPPQNRPPGRPAGRMPDFGGSPMFPPPRPPRRAEMPAETEEQRPVERREPRPETVERRERRPETGERKAPLPEYAAPTEERTSRSERAEGPTDGSMEEQPDAERPYRFDADIRPLTGSEGTRMSAVAVRPVQAPHLAPDPARADTAASEEARSLLTRDDLTRAVVWAEILGPPRARKPFGK